MTEDQRLRLDQTGAVPVRGSLPVTMDREAILNDSWEATLSTAARRLQHDARRKGYTITEKEARDTAADRYYRGEHDVADGAFHPFTALNERLSGGR